MEGIGNKNKTKQVMWANDGEGSNSAVSCHCRENTNIIDILTERHRMLRAEEGTASDDGKSEDGSAGEGAAEIKCASKTNRYEPAICFTRLQSNPYRFL